MDDIWVNYKSLCFVCNVILFLWNCRGKLFICVCVWGEGFVNIITSSQKKDELVHLHFYRQKRKRLLLGIQKKHQIFVIYFVKFDVPRKAGGRTKFHDGSFDGRLGNVLTLNWFSSVKNSLFFLRSKIRPKVNEWIDLLFSLIDNWEIFRYTTYTRS